MVSTVNGATGSTEISIPAGRYRVVGWDLDTTGRRLIDEICQIAAFSPSSKFSQYVMPHRDISIGAQRRHNIRVVTIGRYRMLKDSKTGKILKTKSEISALTDFLQWLEDLRGSSLDGIILINHEPFRVIAPMLLESLRRYNLLDRFSAVVKGFVNGYKVAEAKCAESVRFFPLRTLSKMLLDKDVVLDNAEDRAELIYEIAHRLCVEDDKPDEIGGGGDCAAEDTNLILGKAIYKFGVTLEVEEEAIEEIKLVLDRQKSLTPVFASQLRANLRQRQRATVLRRLLAIAGIEFAMLAKNYAEAGNTGIDNVLATLSSAKPRDISDLKDMLLRYFDPSYKPPADIKPRNNNRQRKPRKGSVSDTPVNATKTESSPDASSASTSARSENGSPAKLQDATEQVAVKVEVETPKPPRSEVLLTVNKQERDDVPATERSESKPIIPGVQPASSKSKPLSPTPESKPLSSAPESKPLSSAPESKPLSSAPESKPLSSAPESKPLSPAHEPKPLSPATTAPGPKPLSPATTAPEPKPLSPATTAPEPKPLSPATTAPVSKPLSPAPESKPLSPAPESKPLSPAPESKPLPPALESNTILESNTTSVESKPSLPEVTFALSEPPKISSVSSSALHEQSTTESEVVEQKYTNTDSPAS